jgi:hypothetical protein
LEIWQNKIRSLRKYLKGWAKTRMGLTRKRKKKSQVKQMNWIKKSWKCNVIATWSGLKALFKSTADPVTLRRGNEMIPTI